MPSNMSDAPALRGANGITQAHRDGDREMQETPRAIQPSISSRQNKDNYTPTLQTLKDFLATCHTLNQATKAFLDTPPRRQDTLPSLQGKVYPQKIVKSTNFMEKQMEVWQLLLRDATSSLQQTIFPSAEQVHDKFFVVETVAGEKRLCPFDRLGVSATVLTLVRQVLGDQALRETVGIGGKVGYTSAGRCSFLGVPTEPQYHDDPYEDERYRGLSIFSNINNGRPLSVVAIEYRPKDFSLDSSMLAALEDGVVPTWGNNGDSSSPAGVITTMIAHLFNYMVESGVNYGYLYSIEGIIFLEIQKDPSIVHYFVSLPRDEVDNHIESTMPYSAVSQICAFVIRAVRAKSSCMKRNDQADGLAAWKNEIVGRENNIDKIAMQLQQWGNPNVSSVAGHENQEKMDTDADTNEDEIDNESYDKFDVEISEETSMNIEIKMDSDLMEEDLPAAGAAPLDQQQDQMEGLTSQHEHSIQNDEEEEDKENQNENGQDITPVNDDYDDEMHEGKDVVDNVDLENNKNDDQILCITKDRVKSIDSKKREDTYCTHKCLLGVANGTPLDQACPNFRFHGTKHISKDEFLERLKDQLSRAGEANAHCSPLELWGSIGTLFKVTLVGYGYTFVTKATLRANWVYLHREGEMYGMLKDIQGSCIPVCLGIVRVDPEFWHEHRLLSQFMVLSWAGLPVYENFDEGEKSLFGNSVFRAYSELHRAGLQHRDADLSNMLYNPQLGRIMIVDFHGARFHPDSLAGFDADGNDMAKQSEDDGEDDDEGVPYQADGSVSKNGASGDGSSNANASETLQQSVDKAECLRKEFEEECRRELIHAVNLMDYLVWGLHGRRS
ncbi:uncharacterized protein TrAFT101_000624 [Trichoderma asperellum]|uniref:Protein kinase domain-containing protein n=1 Tax=Trichoderma asperellum (strain ATCC 204424 / CBS 433.97 / NBRC 101777) TaxID=1042311 RepID=A0A2T3ZK38_TRIA4|nr:hypothetical protein M441DRAFT_54247 [Trichoderma asperellum CBS 433.97]PTB45165.1 hypothetical protein M441DRAFT_54247 [Trichoderma asperellum CBS 433.97]UKZ84727.1 hypothetical protein TrAFT101_000624 [Trichoderma asperellum]